MPQPTVADVTVCIRASGYVSKTQVVQSAFPASKTITLEYITEHELSFFSDNEYSRPVAGAKVTFWKGRPATRPVSRKLTVSLGTFNLKNINPVVVQREPDGIKIVAGIGNPYRSNESTPEGKEIPPEGAMIVGVGGIMWNPGVRPHFTPRLLSFRTNSPSSVLSRLLRIWDTLSLSGSDPTSFPPLYIEHFEWSHENKIRYAEFFLLEFSDTMEKVGETITDENGRCHFTAPTPGLFYVQAEKDGMRSYFLTLHPLRCSVKSRMYEQTRLIVNTLKAGFDPVLTNFGVIPNVDLIIKNKDAQRGGIYAFRTDGSGFGYIDNLPWGTYEMTLTPPDEWGLPPKKVDVTLDKPRLKKNVYFDMDYHEISGRVIEKDTRIPVPNYWLLLCMLKPEAALYAQVKTNAQGEFAFTNALPGSYRIIDLINTRKPPEFMPDPSRYSYQFLTEVDPFQIDGYPVVMEDQDVRDIELPVMPAPVTTWSGIVVDSKGKPVPGAVVTLEHEDIDLDKLQPEQITDHQGFFRITRFGYPDKTTVHQSVLVGYVGNRISVNLGDFEPAQEHLQPVASGSISVNYHIGDTIDSLIIEINNENKYSLEGIVLDPQGQEFWDKEVYAVQKGIHLYAEKRKDGRFLISGLDPGALELFVHPCMYLDNTVGYPIIRNYDYFTEQINLRIEEGAQPPFVEVTLRKIGHLAGYLHDQQGQSLEYATIQLGHTSTDTPDYTTETNAQGRFQFDFLRCDLSYNLTASTNEGPVGSWEGLVPSDDEIQLQLEN
ncbi:MAG: carboxypeptidase regulatory-like domain-containing protein [Candidatus Omnitrophota bacterium]|nr:MAG: carboxypeptidase regulatory-like domain-containing protein [Candidatus Omnitrophota bacterium]